MSIEAKIQEFSAIAANPAAQLKKFKDEGKKVVGVLPYYAPEELVYAAGMVPMGIWGSNDKTIVRSKEYCATFYCTIAQLALEMLLDGTMDQLDALITPTICDTLRPMSQNFRVAVGSKIPCIFLAHPQNRFADWGVEFCKDQYRSVLEKLAFLAGHDVTNKDILKAIKVYNASRAARREFVKLANEHCDVVNPIQRSAVLKASYFMLKDEYTEKLVALNEELKALPAANWKGTKVVTSGIICDNPKLWLMRAAASASMLPRTWKTACWLWPCSSPPWTTTSCCTTRIPTRTVVLRTLWPRSRRAARRVWCCSCSSSATPRRWSIPT